MPKDLFKISPGFLTKKNFAFLTWKAKSFKIKKNFAFLTWKTSFSNKKSREIS